MSSLNKARVIGQGNNPTLYDLQVYINMSAAEIDAILTNKGYSVPVSSSYPAAVNFLNGINARGALALMEEASPSSINLDRAQKAYDDAKRMLVDAQSIMDAPKDVARAEPRGPGVTTPNGVTPGCTLDPVTPWYGGARRDPVSTPMFSRTMAFAPSVV